MKINAMGVLTDSLRTYNLQKGDLDELYGIFRSVNDYDIPIVRYIIYPSSGLIRQRINPHGKEFYSISELNYPPAICLPKYGRVNLPYQSMFYACSFTDTNSVDVPFPRIVSLLETSSFFKDKDSVGIERATVSRWEVTKPLNLIALPFVDEYRRPCPEVLNFTKSWHDIMQDVSVNPNGLELIQYMSNEISKDFASDHEYMIIANFVNYLLNVNMKTKDSDGIIYPSVPAQGGGFNVAIKPNAADTKIRFVGASLCHLLKQRDESYVAIMKDAHLNPDGTLTYTDRVLSKEEMAIYEQYADGLTFVN